MPPPIESMPTDPKMLSIGQIIAGIYEATLLIKKGKDAFFYREWLSDELIRRCQEPPKEQPDDDTT